MDLRTIKSGVTPCRLMYNRGAVTLSSIRFKCRGSIHPIYIAPLCSALAPPLWHLSLLTDTRPRLCLCGRSATCLHTPTHGLHGVSRLRRRLFLGNAAKANPQYSFKLAPYSSLADILVRPTACRRFNDTILSESFDLPPRLSRLLHLYHLRGQPKGFLHP